MLLNKVRGKGVTVFGAVGSLMPKPLFIMERTTNSHNFMRFLRRLRKLFEQDDRTIHLILDNHRGHHTLEAKAYAVKKKIALHFMPPYSPELNAIEPLWSVLKRDFKSRMLEHRVDRVEEPFFRQILWETLQAITPEQGQHAARFNNRKFLLRCIEELLEKQPPHSVEESKSEAVPEIGEEDRRLLQSFISASANELQHISDAESSEDDLSSIERGRESPFSSGDDDIPPIDNSNNSILNSENAERNQRILVGDSGISTPRQAAGSLNQSVRSIRSIGDFLVKKGSAVLSQMRRR